jgi:hypothetical protein
LGVTAQDAWVIESFPRITRAGVGSGNTARRVCESYKYVAVGKLSAPDVESPPIGSPLYVKGNLLTRLLK